MEFTKAHGAGNDFVMVEDVNDRLRISPQLVAALCDRHKGVGADGLIRITKSGVADFFMDYYNSDGQTAEMCGNGIRCLAKYVADHGLFHGETMRVETRAGIKDLMLYYRSDGSVDRVRVDMGVPIFERSQIPVGGTGKDAIHERITVDGYEFDAAILSMGNPHCLLFVPDLDAVPFEMLGPKIETHEMFPSKVNAEFVQVLNKSEVRVRVWERGVGETQACGSGACATAVGSHLRGFTGREVAVRFPGGTVEIEWGTDNHVLMTGPAEEVFHGTLDSHIAHRLLGWPVPSR